MGEITINKFQITNKFQRSNYKYQTRIIFPYRFGYRAEVKLREHREGKKGEWKDTGIECKVY